VPVGEPLRGGVLARVLQDGPIKLQWQPPEAGAAEPVVGIREPPIAKFAPPSAESIGARLTRRSDLSSPR